MVRILRAKRLVSNTPPLRSPILFRITTVPVSIHLLLTGQLRFMSENGFDVFILSADDIEREIIIEEEGCQHHIIPFTRTITPWQDLKCLWYLIQVIRKLRPNIIHTHTPKAGLLGMLAGRFTNVPIRIHTIAGLPFMTAIGIKRQLLIAMEKLTYWGAQHVWPNSQSMLEFVRQQRLCPDDKLDIISNGSSNGIDLEQFSPAAIQPDKLELIKSTFNHDPNCRYILAVGRIVKDKGIPELVEAFGKISRLNSTLRLLLIGPMEKERREELLPSSTLMAIKTNEAIHHIDWTDEVAYYLYLSDILVHASHREGFPNVPLQAGAMCCPIICSAIPGNVDIVTHEKTGLTFPAKDTEALRSCLERSLKEPQQAKAMAQRLHQHIEQYFDRKIIHQALLDKYTELLAAEQLKR